MPKIALAQMDVRWGDPEANRHTARDLVAQAAAAGTDLVVLPELWGSGYDLAHAARYATPLQAGLFAAMASWAQEHGLYVVGSLLEADQGRIFNTCALFGPGALVGHYRKLHRFRLMDEDRYLDAGDRPTLCEGLPWGATALAVCYDLRFPELFRRYALSGARLVVIPAEWPRPRIEHWRVLLRARAIENQCFVAACNRVGSDPDNVFGGASAVIDPAGEALIEGDEAGALLFAEVDLKKADAVRRHIPVLSDRRPECY